MPDSAATSSRRRRHSRHLLRRLIPLTIPIAAFLLPVIPTGSAPTPEPDPVAPRGSLHIEYPNKPAEPALGDWNGRLTAVLPSAPAGH